MIALFLECFSEEENRTPYFQKAFEKYCDSQVSAWRILKAEKVIFLLLARTRVERPRANIMLIN